jgi:hypothetical protein
MIIELNIGLNVANGDNSAHALISRDVRALQFLRNSAYLSNVISDRLAVSNTEQTRIVALSLASEDESSARAEIFELAVWLEQDCIAVYNATAMSGALIGPNAAAWGTFNPDYFIRVDATAPAAQIYTPKTAASAVAYTGHGAATGGLQGHSVGSDYPYMIVGVQDRAEAPTRYRVMDTRTSKMSDAFPNQLRAIIEMTTLRCRNLMHS